MANQKSERAKRRDFQLYQIQFFRFFQEKICMKMYVNFVSLQDESSELNLMKKREFPSIHSGMNVCQVYVCKREAEDDLDWMNEWLCLQNKFYSEEREQKKVKSIKWANFQKKNFFFSIIVVSMIGNSLLSCGYIFISRWRKTEVTFASVNKLSYDFTQWFWLMTHCWSWSCGFWRTCVEFLR